MLVDTHTHIDQHDPAELPDILERAQKAGVGRIIVAGVTIASSERCIALTAQHPEVLWAGVGVHPMEVTGPLANEEIEELERLARSKGVVCISEIGLDHQAGMPDRAAQEQAFRAQTALAVKLRLPVIFHNREAGFPLLDVLREEAKGRVPLVAHYFQGPRDYAFACLEQGVYLSLAKPLLRLPELQELVRRDIPLDRILLETDSYPQPFKKHRSSWTEPAHLQQVAAKVAELKGLTVEEVEAVTMANLGRVLGREIVTPQQATRR
ncbi:MAG: TatD family deoxyribonuclease [SAR202 cluster bacterium]|nr:TatD family deoxyribonuclease [SAR202 cluster bacterium]